MVGFCLIIEVNLGDGVFNGLEFLEYGGVFGVGLDLNVWILFSEELWILEYL